MLSQEKQEANPQNPISQTSEPQNTPNQQSDIPQSLSVRFLLMGVTVLELDVVPQERLSDIAVCLKEDPLAALLRNFQFNFQNSVVDPLKPIQQILEEAKEPQSEDTMLSTPVVFELSPGSMDNECAQKSLLALIHLIQDPRRYLASKAYAYFEVVNRQDILTLATQNLDFGCCELSLQDSLSSDLTSALQFVSVQKQEQNVKIRVQNSPPSQDSTPQIRFLRSLKLSANRPDYFVAEEDFFQLDVETLEDQEITLVFCRRGVYVAQSIDKIAQGSQKRRQSGYYSSVITALAAQSPIFEQHFQEFFELYSSFKSSKNGAFHVVELLMSCDFNNNYNLHRFWLADDELLQMAHLSTGNSNFHILFSCFQVLSAVSVLSYNLGISA